MAAEDGGYELFVKSELEKLCDKLVQKYQVDVRHASEKSRDQVVLGQNLQPISHSASGVFSTASIKSKIADDPFQPDRLDLSTATAYSMGSLSSLDLGGGSKQTVAQHNWAAMTAKLMDRFLIPESESEEEVASYVKEDILALRAPWKTSLRQHALKREKADNVKSPLLRRQTHRMKDAAMDGSCLQPLVRRPSSKIQILDPAAVPLLPFCTFGGFLARLNQGRTLSVFFMCYTGEPRITWSLLGVLFIVWDMITIPLELFDNEELSSLLLVVGRVSFGYWLLGMPLHAVFGIEIDGHLEMRPRVLLKKYWRSWFGVDLMVIGIDAGLMLVELLSDSVPAGARSARFLRTLRLLRLLRLLRVAKLQRELTKLANNFLSTYAFMVMRIVSGLLMILTVNHIIACCWFGLGRWTLVEDGSSWLLDAGIADAGLADSYATSVHWALTQFTPATNNVAPVNFMERFFAVWVILLAMGTFSSFISSITATVTTLMASRAEQFKHHSSLVRFFNDRNLSTDTYSKINDVLRRQGMYDVRLKERDVKLLQDVPEHLKVMLHEEMFMASLTSLCIWKRWRHEEDLLIHRQICHLAMVEHIASPGNDAFMPGTECTQVYLLDQGSMGYIARQFSNLESEIVSPGQVLCLPCLWAEWLHRGRLTANGGTTAYYNGIDCDKFCGLVKQHGNPLWQYLQIYGILVVSEIEHMDAEDIFVTDLPLGEAKMDDIATRAGRFANLVNSRQESENVSLVATLAGIGHTPSQPSHRQSSRTSTVRSQDQNAPAVIVSAEM